MKRAVLYKLGNIIIIHQNDDLFSGQSLGYYLNMWFGLWTTVDNFMDLVDFLNIESWKVILNFNNLRCANILLGGLHV